MSTDQQQAMSELCRELDRLAGVPVADDVVRLFRRMDPCSLQACRNDLQAILTLKQNHRCV